jgi:eukaryotic-like serine/threonine-protein kinase
LLHVGSMLSERYVLREVIARGGMGEVWRAHDIERDRVVAIKTLLPALSEDQVLAARFRTEAQAMAVLSDPSIVEILDFGRSNGTDFIVMTYVEGESLRSLMHRDGPLPADQVMSLVSQAASALHAAHEQGIVHRDVKPSNLLIRPDGRLVLTDFGIARMIATARLTVAGSVLGTVTYVAPEQITGDPVSAATDIYALGVVAYECLAGVPPFASRAAIAVAISHTRDDPPPLPEHVPFPVRRVVLRALAKNPADRWPTAAAMASAAARAATVTPRPMATSDKPSRVRRATRDRHAPSPYPEVPQIPAQAGPPLAEVAPADADAPAAAVADRAPARTRTRRWSNGLFLLGIAAISAITAAAIAIAVREPTGVGDGPARPVPAVDSEGQWPNDTPSPTPFPSDAMPATAAATPARSSVAPRRSTARPGRPASAGTATTATEPTTPPPTPTPPPTSPAAITLPDYTNLTEAAARDGLLSLGLVVQVVPAPGQPCVVIGQSPLAGSQVTPGSTVQITVGDTGCSA